MFNFIRKLKTINSCLSHFRWSRKVKKKKKIEREKQFAQQDRDTQIRYTISLNWNFKKKKERNKREERKENEEQKTQKGGEEEERKKEKERRKRKYQFLRRGPRVEKKWNFAKAEPRWKCHRLFYSAVNGTRHLLLALPLHSVSLFAGIALNLPNATWGRVWRGRKEVRTASDKSIRFKFLKGSMEARVQPGKAMGKKWRTTW